jgi:hypothetical protein
MSVGSVGLGKTGGKIYRSSGAVAGRYARCTRTISRWLQDPDLKFPQPDLVINGKRLWSDETLDRFDEAQRERREGCHRTVEPTTT